MLDVILTYRSKPRSQTPTGMTAKRKSVKGFCMVCAWLASENPKIPLGISPKYTYVAVRSAFRLLQKDAFLHTPEKPRECRFAKIVFVIFV
jgi:hypothetical protein